MSDHNIMPQNLDGREIFLEKLSVLSFSDPQSASKVKSKHPVALNEEKKKQKKTPVKYSSCHKLYLYID